MTPEQREVNQMVDAHENAFLSPCCEADRADGICSSCKRTQWEMALYQEAKLDLLMKQQTKETQEPHRDIDAHLRTIDGEGSRTPLASDQKDSETPLSSDGNSVLRNVRPDRKSIVRTQI